MRSDTSAAPGAVREAPSLSSRQGQILRCLMRGYHNKAIATQLGIGLVTVKMHVGRLFKKLGVTNRTEAAVLGIQLEAGLGVDEPRSRSRLRNPRPAAAGQAGRGAPVMAPVVRRPRK